ncbi:SusC/RagA family TonB-linked outer membrane protein [Sphingobacterium spiritivorum]|uniref:TonB-linked outer membrane protein, SusC/RagA family n=1 Tax=Sphingobacterium spiritivorum ATCC 33861 TaxID=525373 RepID=D7VIA5_SPHSI|nr:SusC/RagA family TonB-linked outer membrane protein [Sphingobacterium spiritivorum]EFK59807.1 TonB-linked outer membrane protein, SusC/RagA family [Sphingobacterium spiritivorum ATCC 33861]QQT37550.1 SusC/RagA family TonB-linked outer membrane protein [Sphingobacterium spiritivorum]SUI97273.1 Outer membrane receptor for monomeric catechols [Sphingobacterium spiritivorum]
MKEFYISNMKKILFILLFCFGAFQDGIAEGVLANAIPVKAVEQELFDIKGVVKDAVNGNPVEGVTILAGNKSIGKTDENGKFSFSVLKGTQVSFRGIGYTTHNQTINKENNNLTISLQPNETALSEVVVTALGIKRDEKALGYSATVVKGEQFTDALSNNWTDALSGKVAGVNLMRSNSGPTGSTKIILRGESNLNGDPGALIIVDGIVVSNGSGRKTAIGGESAYGTSADNMPADYGSGIDDINPEDIENVTVLKGPGAAALYGARGASGAIIITTKSGSKGKKGIGVTVNSNTAFESVNRWPDMQYEYGQGLDGSDYYSYGTTVDGTSTSGTSSAYGPKFDGQMFFQYDPLTNTTGKERTPWVPYKNQIRDIFEVGRTYTNSVSIDGGTDRTTARFSATNVNNSWILPNTGFKRNTVALSVNSKVSDKLTISSKINYTNKWSDNLPGAGYGNQSLMYWFIFWQPNADLNWLKDYWRPGEEGLKIRYPFSSYPENPYAISNEFINRSNRQGVTGNVQASYQFNKEWSLQLRSAIDFAYEDRAQERPFDAGSKLTQGSFRTQSIFSNENTIDFLLKYDKKINKDWNVSATLGGSRMQNKYKKEELRADSLTFPGVYTFANAKGPLDARPYSSKFEVNSLYALLTASYKDYLFFDVTGRQDWSSTLASVDMPDKNLGFFYPSVNLSFIASEYFTLPKQINYAKFRASIAGVGSGGTDPYLTGYSYETAGSLYSGGLQMPTTLGNGGLKPLKTNSYEIGADLRFFKSRLGIDVALYKSETKDQHLLRYVDPSTGYRRYVINAGAVSNRGLEIGLNGKPVQNKEGFNWNMFATFTRNTNRIDNLPDSSIVIQTGPVAGGQLVAKVGGSMGDLYGYGYKRSPDGQVVYDANTGYALLSDEIIYLGNTIPKGRASIGSDFSYKGFKLSVLFDAQFGGVSHSLSHYKLAEQGKTTNTLPGRYNGIIGNGVIQNPDGTYRKNDVIAKNIDEYYRSHYGQDNAEGSVFSTDFIKFREARFDYTLNKDLTKRLKIQRATVGVYGRNLFIWSGWPIFDPEFGTLSGTDIVKGFEVAQFPSTRTFGFNIVVGF